MRYTSCAPWKHFQDLAASRMLTTCEVPTTTHTLWTSDTISRLRLQSLIGSAENGTVLSGVDQLSELNTRHPDIHTMLHDPSPYLPSLRRDDAKVKLNGVTGLSEATTGVELMLLIVAAMSNNFEISRMTNLTLDLTQDSIHLFMLGDALSRQLDTMSALAEKLLPSAVQHGRLDLLELLLDTGVDVNLRVSAANNLYPVTALEHAVDQHNTELVKYLLCHGATDWNANFPSRQFFHDTHCQGTIIDLATNKGHLDLVESLLEYASSMTEHFSEVTRCTIRGALLLGRTEVVTSLYSQCPVLFDEAKAVPWMFFEAAAVCEDVKSAESLVNLLCDWGFDITSTSAPDNGSALAAASKVRNMAMIRSLILAEVVMNTVAVGANDSCVESTCCCEGYKAKFYGTCGKSALHIAIDNDHYALVQLLLSHGADPSQVCGLYPIQAAAAKGNPETVALIIRAGADVNATYHRGRGAKDCGNLPALQIALISGKIEAAEILYEASASLFGDLTENWQQPTLTALLSFLIENGSREFVLGTISE